MELKELIVEVVQAGQHIRDGSITAYEALTVNIDVSTWVRDQIARPLGDVDGNDEELLNLLEVCEEVHAMVLEKRAVGATNESGAFPWQLAIEIAMLMLTEWLKNRKRQ